MALKSKKTEEELPFPVDTEEATQTEQISFDDIPFANPAEKPIIENLIFGSENPSNGCSAVPIVAYFDAINGNSKAAEVFADNAKIVGEVISDGSVKIGQSSVIIGNITATSAVVAGAVKGDIDVQGPVILDASAIVMGNIKSKSVQINNGAVIEGMCSQCYADVSPTSFFEVFKDAKK